MSLEQINTYLSPLSIKRTYLAPNETKFEGVCDSIRSFMNDESFDYVGILGGVDTNFNYITNLNPDRSTLVDMNPFAFEYAKMRLQNLSNIKPDFNQEQIFDDLEDVILRYAKSNNIEISDLRYLMKSRMKLEKYSEEVIKKNKDFLWTTKLNDAKSNIKNISFSLSNILEDKFMVDYSKNMVIYLSNILEWQKGTNKDIENSINFMIENNFSKVERGVIINSHFERNKILGYFGSKI